MSPSHTFASMFQTSFFFCEFMDLDSVSVHKHAKKELGQSPAMATSHLVNNPFIEHRNNAIIEHNILNAVHNSQQLEVHVAMERYGQIITLFSFTNLY